MRLLHLVPTQTHIDFVRPTRRRIYFAFLILAITAAIALFMVRGLNLGIDFAGGILLEVRSEAGAVDVGGLRDRIGTLNVGNFSIQNFGAPDDVLIRIQQPEGGDEAVRGVVEAVKAELGEGWEYRRIETVGPTVGDELIEVALLAVSLALGAIMLYIWLRFEWQFGLAAVIALLHDVLFTVGFFSLSGIEFNLATVAAILTIAGYSINDTVVLFDRIRENLRKYKTKPLPELFNISINETLSRTLMTSVTTLLALLALFFLGGEIIRGFSLALIVGVLIGTYSSICLATPFLLNFDLRKSFAEEGDNGGDGAPSLEKASS